MQQCRRQIFQYPRLIKLSLYRGGRASGRAAYILCRPHSNATPDHFTSRDQKLLCRLLLYLHTRGHQSLHSARTLLNKGFTPLHPQLIFCSVGIITHCCNPLVCRHGQMQQTHALCSTVCC